MRQKRAFESSRCTSEEQPPIAKRRRTTPPRYPSQFWDELSRIPFTRGALRELDRRTAAQQDRSVVKSGKASKTTSQRLLRSDHRRLQGIAKKGGLDLTSLRGYATRSTAAVTMSRSSSTGQKRSLSSSKRSGSTSQTRNTSPYNPAFEQMIIDQGVHPAWYRSQDGKRLPKPSNVEDIRGALAQSRASLSPSRFSESRFEAFQDSNEASNSESQIMTLVIPMIAGPGEGRYVTTGDKLFNNLEKFHPDIPMPKPDRASGASPSEIDPRVRDELGRYILPCPRLAAPNNFLAGKSSSGRADVAQRQAMYDGAVGARAMFHLQNYGNATRVYDSNAYTLASSYHPGTGTLQMYATHPGPPAQAGGHPQYYTTQLDSYAMTGNVIAFRAGAAAYRNGQAWSQQQRNRLIAEANHAAHQQSTETRSVSEMVDEDDGLSDGSNGLPDSETSADELSSQVPTKRLKRPVLPHSAQPS